MLAYVYEGEGAPALKDAPAPVPRPDNAVLEVAACSICGTDVRTHRFGNPKITPPRILGHEAVGRLIHVGKNVPGFAVGDRVAVAPAVGCGRCRACRRGHTNMCDDLRTFGFQFDGGFAERMEIPLHAFEMTNVTRLPEGLSWESAALAEPVACCINAQEYLRIAEGDSVAVFGAGFIGCMHARLARRTGARSLVIVEPMKRRAEEARRMFPGALVIDPAATDVEAAARDLTGGAGVDVAIIACSVGEAQAAALRVAGKCGRVSLFGGIPGDAKGFLDSNDVHYKELSVFGAHASTPEQNRRALAWIAAGEISVNEFARNAYPLKDIDAAFAAILKGDVAKAIIRPQSA